MSRYHPLFTTPPTEAFGLSRACLAKNPNAGRFIIHMRSLLPRCLGEIFSLFFAVGLSIRCYVENDQPRKNYCKTLCSRYVTNGNQTNRVSAIVHRWVTRTAASSTPQHRHTEQTNSNSKTSQAELEYNP